MVPYPRILDIIKNVFEISKKVARHSKIKDNNTLNMDCSIQLIILHFFFFFRKIQVRFRDCITLCNYRFVLHVSQNYVRQTNCRNFAPPIHHVTSNSAARDTSAEEIPAEISRVPPLMYCKSLHIRHLPFKRAGCQRNS